MPTTIGDLEYFDSPAPARSNTNTTNPVLDALAEMIKTGKTVKVNLKGEDAAKKTNAIRSAFSKGKRSVIGKIKISNYKTYLLVSLVPPPPAPEPVTAEATT